MKGVVALGCLAVLLGVLLTVGPTHPGVVGCLHVGEGPHKETPERFRWNPALQQEWGWADTLLPGRLLWLDTRPLTPRGRKNHGGEMHLLVQVNGDEVDPEQTPELFGAALKRLGQRGFQQPSRYGVLEVKVFRHELFAYRASLYRNPGGPPDFFVQQDWQCLHEARMVYPGLP